MNKILKMAKKPILYYATLSPPSRAVLLTTKHINLDIEYRLVDLFKLEHLTPEFIKMNPQHTVPTLDDNGAIIYDSHTICGYLVDKYAPDNALYPKDLVKRAHIDSKLHFDTGYLFARMRFIFEPILFFGSAECPQEKIDLVQDAYVIMEASLQDSPYLCGDNITIADYCCVATISTVNGIVPIDRENFPKLQAWMDRLSQLPYYKTLNGEGAQGLIKIVKKRMSVNKSKL